MMEGTIPTHGCLGLRPGGLLPLQYMAARGSKGDDCDSCVLS